MLADEVFQPFSRLFRVKFFFRIGDLRGIPIEHGAVDTRKIERIAVRLFFGGILRLERFRHGDRFPDANVGGKFRVDGKRELFQRKRLRRVLPVKMRFLPQCVHARVRSSRTVQRHFLSEQRGDRVCQNALYRAFIRLDLPPEKIRSVIFNGEKYAHKPPFTAKRGAIRRSRRTRARQRS